MDTMTIRKLADTSKGERVPGYHPQTGEKVLYNPETNAPEPWPLMGVMFVGEPPEECKVGMKWVIRAEHEGWVRVEGKDVIFKPGGPPEDPWRVTHTFIHAKFIIVKTIEGEYRYRVKNNPDKREGMSGPEVDWSFHLELVKK